MARFHLQFCIREHFYFLQISSFEKITLSGLAWSSVEEIIQYYSIVYYSITIDSIAIEPIDSS